MKNVIVTGAAGFIGSNLTDYLLIKGYRVLGYDNFSTGFEENLSNAMNNPNFTLVKGDLLNLDLLKKSFAGYDFVFHLAANADVRFGLDHPYKDLEQNTIVTFNVLEAMRENSITDIAFSSTGSIYGEPEVFPTPETATFPVQTSLYGASKLACEGLIQAYCEGYGFKGWIFRFVSILGERYSHGHVFDFYRKLLNDPSKLHVLGNGKQRKSYLYIEDCITAMFTAIEKSREKVNIFNLGTDEFCEVNDSVGWICNRLSLSPEIILEGGERGWIGDSPYIFLDCSKLRDLGWHPEFTIQESIIKTLDFLIENDWLLSKRD